MWGQTQPTVPMTVAETGLSCLYSMERHCHQATARRKDQDTQFPMGVMGTPAMKDGPLRVAVAQHRHPELCWPLWFSGSQHCAASVVLGCGLSDYYAVGVPSTELPDGQGHVWFILPSWP